MRYPISNFSEKTRPISISGCSKPFWECSVPVNLRWEIIVFPETPMDPTLAYSFQRYSSGLVEYFENLISFTTFLNLFFFQISLENFPCMFLDHSQSPQLSFIRTVKEFLYAHVFAHIFGNRKAL